MKKIVLITTLIALPFGLSACDKAADTPKAEASTNAKSDMAMSAEVKTGKGSGIVTAIDATSGKITLDHGPVVDLEWPAMKMGFSAKRVDLESIAVGDAVSFEMEWDGKKGEITKITKNER